MEPRFQQAFKVSSIPTLTGNYSKGLRREPLFLLGGTMTAQIKSKIQLKAKGDSAVIVDKDIVAT